MLPACGKAAGLAEKCRVLLRSMTVQILSLTWNVSSVEGRGKFLLPTEMVSPSPLPSPDPWGVTEASTSLPPSDNNIRTHGVGWRMAS